MSAATKEIIDYIFTCAGLCHECSGDFAPGFLLIQIALLLIGSGIAIFDTVTDWNIVIQFRDVGFQNPLLPIDVNWLRAWYLFAVIGTVLTTVTILHESLDVLHSLWQFCKKYCCKSQRHYNVLNETQESIEMPGKNKGSDSMKEDSTEKQEDECEDNHHNHQYHLYQDGSDKDIEEKDKRQDTSDKQQDHVENGTDLNDECTDSGDDENIDDACKCCYRFGWNFTTRAEMFAFFTLWFHDVPMLTMAVLYAFSQSTCKLPEREDVSGELLDIGISATASTVAAAYRLTRSLIRLFISVGVRIRSKKEASKMGKCGKCCSKFLPEKGDAIYPQDTCAEWCIVPYYASLIFDFTFVSFGASIALSIWINYIISKQGANFDDSLAIYRFTVDGNYVPINISISNDIIVLNSSGSYVVLETLYDINQFTYCLSEFQYREKDAEIVYNTIELQPISTNGTFCTAKSGSNPQLSDSYSSCTLYYGSSDALLLHYGFSDPITGETKLFEDECIVLKDKLPRVHAGPKLERSIDVEGNIQNANLNADEELFILYVRNDTHTILFNVPVADIIAAGLDKTIVRTFMDPVTGENVTYLVRFQYQFSISQFIYNVREVVNYPLPADQLFCRYKSPFDQIGFFVYGYFNAQTGHYQELMECSFIPRVRLRPLHIVQLSVSCFYLN